MLTRILKNLPRTVYIVGGGDEYHRMFEESGWKTTDEIKKADLLQFTGGADVTPALYGHKKHKTTHSFLIRDKREQIIFNIGLKKQIPMTGICRGGQFLNVMNGGTLWQNVGNHCLSGTHPVEDILTHKTFQATSTHHQMMEPSRKGVTVLIAKEGGFKEKTGKNCNIRLMGGTMNDVEAIYYEDSNSFCFQPHPEFAGFDILKKKYFEYLDKFLF